MISEEKFKEIMSNKGVIYGLDDDNEVFEINTEYLHYPKKYGTDEIFREVYVCAYDKGNSTSVFSVAEDYSNVFENKEEAEFVEKYHCSKIIRFEPPTFEEFMNNKSWHGFNKLFILYYDNNRCYFKNCFEIGYDMESLDERNTKLFKVENGDVKQAYYKAVEYARKLFLGEEE